MSVADTAPVGADVALAAIQASVAVAAPLLGNVAATDAASAAAAKVSAPGTKPQAASDATPKDAAAKTADTDTSTSTGKPSEQAATAVGGSEAVDSQWTAMAVDHGGGAHTNAMGVSASASGTLDVGGQQAPTVVHPASASHAGAELQGAALNVNDGASGLAANQGPRMLATGPGQLEVGVMDGTHGWVQIRAQVGETGAVSASLTAGAATHESLRDAVPAMASYLEAEAVNVSRIAVHRAAESSPAMAQPQDGSGQDRNAQADRESKQNTRSDADLTGSQSTRNLYDTAPASSAPDISGGTLPGANWGNFAWMGSTSPTVFSGGLPFGSAGSSGGWLNVMA
jgi:hypothetical protein